MTTLLDYDDFTVDGDSPHKALKRVVLVLSDLRAMDSFVYRLYGAKSFSNDLDAVIIDLCRIIKAMEKESDF